MTQNVFLSLLWLSASTQFILLRGHLSLRHFYYKTWRLLLLLQLLLLLLDQSDRDVCRFLPQRSKTEKTSRNRNIIEEKNQFPRFSFFKAFDSFISSDHDGDQSEKTFDRPRDTSFLGSGCHERLWFATFWRFYVTFMHLERKIGPMLWIFT